MDWTLKARGVFGLFVLLGLCWALSTNRRAVAWRIVGYGLALQITFALLILKTEPGRAFFAAANSAITSLLGFADAGIGFLLGPVLADKSGEGKSMGVIFLFHILPTIIFFAALMSLLYHLGILQWVVKGVAWVMQKTMKTSGAETLSAAANIFVGQTEAPLLVKPFIQDMTKSEMMAVMTGGFATVAGGVMAAYVGMLHDVNPNIAGHLLAGSTMAAPTGLVVAKLLVPETEVAKTANTMTIHVEKNASNVVDAAATGASEGMTLVLNVAAMLLAFVALVNMFDVLLAWSGDHLYAWTGAAVFEDLSLPKVFGWIFAPLAWLMGIESGDVQDVGRLLGEKLVLTEFTAYRNLGTSGDLLSPRSFTMASYALCGFANFASIAIQIGGIGAMAPSRRSDLARLGVKAMFAGFLTTCITATVAGILI